MFNKFPNYLQYDQMDCGPTCLQIIAKHFGKKIPISHLRQICQTTRLGTSLKGVSIGAETIGLKTLSLQLNLNQLLQEAPLPCIVHWKKKHFIVLYKVNKDIFYVSDPAFGLLQYSKNEFLKGFTGQSKNEEIVGFALLLDTTSKFFEEHLEYEVNKIGIRKFLGTYVLKYKKFINQLVIGLLATSLLNLIFPFLTQAIVDIGIQNQDINFIYLILFSQLMLFIGKSGIDIIKSWLLLHVTKRININILTDFFRKLMRLPISFFDIKMIGDLIQRISDHERIENFITNTSINTIFSLINLIIFSIVLGIYDPLILIFFLLFSIVYTSWILIFMKKRRELDYKSFSEQSENQSKIYEILGGMQEIKLNNAELSKRWEWERIQAKIFKITLRNLSLEQIQSVGAQLINELKNIIISFYSAKLVIDGDLTLGMMLSVSYMIGQLNQPFLQLIDLLKSGQSAKIGLERLTEIHGLEEEDGGKSSTLSRDSDLKQSITISNLSFRYDKLSENYLFKDLSIEIPSKKTTAIVGLSGSGKTTLLKLLLKFYKPEQGLISVGDTDLEKISTPYWRSNCGTVMQEGVVFPDTIANNIALGEDIIDYSRLEHSIKMANIEEYTRSLPYGYNTVIGKSGISMSTGQKQRILIARAIYKNPEFLIFDEATSSLDAENEKVIMNNLNEFSKSRTVIVVAHRLSTVKNADQIIVLQSGKIIERGVHSSLVELRGTYFNLVKNQLELGL
jgi:ATP-binding cassette, subfamily B, bacterial